MKYPILGIKSLDLKDFISVTNLLTSNKYSQEEKQSEIIKIKNNINTKRK